MKLRIFLMGVCLIFSAAVFSACGPDGSNHDAREADKREQEEKNKAENSKALGVYYGFIINTELKKKFAARLTVKAVTILVTSPGSTDVSRIPSLGGDLTLPSDKPNGADELMGLYTVGDFNGKTGEVSLWSTQSITNGGISIFSFSGIINGDDISGDVTTPYRTGMRFEGHRN